MIPINKLKLYSTVFGSIIWFCPRPILRKIESEVYDETYLAPSSDSADVAFVFGAENDLARIKRAYELYSNQMVKKILVSGGVSRFNTDKDSPEVNFLAQQLLDWGVKKADLIIESEATNTTENAEFSIAKLKKLGYNINSLKFIVISSDFHIKRCATSLIKTLKDNRTNVYCSPTAHPTVTRENWTKTNLGRFLIFKEYLQLRSTY